MKYLILGCNGMAGHLISIYLKENGNDVLGFARKESKYIKTIIGDAYDTNLVSDIILGDDYDAVINCIGVLNGFAEEDHESASFLNSYFPNYLAKITKNMKTQIVQLSTDCVFSGRGKGGYTENDLPNGESFYDRSKALGELVDSKNITFRTSIVGPDINSDGIGLLNWFMRQKYVVNGYNNVIWTGQTTLQLAKTIDIAVRKKINGLYNMVPNSSISKFELLELFNKYLRNDMIEIIPEYDVISDKSLKRTNYDGFDYEIPDYEKQVRELGIWMNEHKNLYPHYEMRSIV